MLGISLPIAATAAILVADPVETREMTLKCEYVIVHFNPITRVARHGWFRSHADGDASHIVFRINTGDMMRINWDTMAFVIKSGDSAHEPFVKRFGVCRELP